MVQNQNVRIGNLEAGVLIASALFFDGVQFMCTLLVVIPLVGWVLGPMLAFLVTIVAYILLLTGIKIGFPDVHVLKGKQARLKMFGLFGSLVVELMPLISMIPSITGFVLTVVIASRIEDTIGFDTLSKLVTRRDRERNRFETNQQQQMARAEARGPKEVAKQQKRSQRARTEYEQRVARQNRAIIQRTVFGRPRTRNTAEYQNELERYDDRVGSV